jgi:hypothetical protein
MSTSAAEYVCRLGMSLRLPLLFAIEGGVVLGNPYRAQLLGGFALCNVGQFSDPAGLSEGAKRMAHAIATPRRTAE